MKDLHSVKTLYDIFDKAHPDMTEDELLELCEDLKILKLKNNRFINNRKKELTIGIADLQWDSEMSYMAAYYEDSNEIKISRRFIKDCVEKDTPFLLMMYETHELEHCAQKFQNDRVLKNLYNQTSVKRNFGQNSIDYENYMLIDKLKFKQEDYGILYDTVAILTNAQIGYQIVNSHKKMCSKLYWQLYYNNHREIGAHLHQYAYIVGNLEHYIQKQTDEKRKQWLTTQLEILEIDTNRYLKYIDKTREECSSNKFKYSYIGNMLNVMYAMLNVKRENFFQIRLPLLYKLANNMCSLGYLSGCISENFRKDYMINLNKLFKNKLKILQGKDEPCYDIIAFHNDSVRKISAYANEEIWDVNLSGHEYADFVVR